MSLRERISADLKQAMKDKDATRLSTLRLISAAIKDRDIALRGEGEDRQLSEAEIVAILTRMVKQRQDSARAYEEGGRLELVERENAEIDVIEDYLPRQLGEDEIAEAIEVVIAETGAASIRDMGGVINRLKARHAGQMDFGKVGPLVKARLAQGTQA
ncbi:MAG: GatB/YqeY domain-containing protein [Pararhodobacter sp.]|nr:GatB/YqeY domain-containing protein [Pararhodobacter sp.]